MPLVRPSVILLFLVLLSSLAFAQESLPVQAQVPRGTYYVGQSIELRIGVPGAGEEPRVQAPLVADADVSLIRVDPVQRGTSAIGNQITERILYVFRYRVIPHRAGDLVIPPVVARLGQRAGASPTLTIRVLPLPAAGRPASFLGGVGWIEAEAEAWPTTVRAGQTLEYRIKLEGPGARSSTQTPQLPDLSRLPVAPQVEPLETEAVMEPPSRVFRWRIRPTSAGEAVLPPLAISYFEPRQKQYFTRTTPSVSFRVVAVPRYDPRSLTYESPASAARQSSRRWWTKPEAVGTIALGVLASGFVIAAVVRLARTLRTAHRKRQDQPERFATRAARRLDPALGAEELARTITADLIRYLFLATGRPEGALTPTEAREAFGQAGQGPDLAHRAAALVEACDRASYSGHTEAARTLADQARAFWLELAARPTAEVTDGQR